MTPTRRRTVEHRMRHLGALQPPDGFGTLLVAQMGPDGPVAMWAGTTPRTVALVRYTAPDLRPRAVVVTRGRVERAHLQPLSDGGYVVAQPRCALTAEGPEPNAVVVGPDGTVARLGTLGDGISHLQVDHEDRIWVGYYDEGVVGNLGWGSDGPAPLGTAGLVRWTVMFTKEWEFPSDAGALIDECCAMNVTNDEVLICADDGSSLIRVRNDRVVTHAAQGVDGATGVVAAGDRVGFIGSYEGPGRVVTARFGHDVGGHPQPGRLTLPDGSPVPPGLGYECRGSTVNVFDGPDWYQLDLHGLDETDIVEKADLGP